ncbi:hypothetical protein [Bosea sp. FBZP-16]|uniref:hypothetical protein n=1 Tax=Bosea sp. FBZP-16 TaxID=2065382 RepID=UPI000C30F89A|nr:hypothetical protein [Bosea sp. FBZP-16]
MSRPLDPFPGGEGCPLEAFRRRAIRAGWTLLALAVFGVAFSIVWLSDPIWPCRRTPEGGIIHLLNCRR